MLLVGFLPARIEPVEIQNNVPEQRMGAVPRVNTAINIRISRIVANSPNVFSVENL